MRSRLFYAFLLFVLSLIIPVTDARAQSTGWIKSLGYNISSFPGFDFQEWDNSLVPTTTVWVLFDSHGPVLYGPRTTLSMIPYPPCGGLFAFAFVSNYYTTGSQFLGTRYECAFRSSIGKPELSADLNTVVET